MPALPNRRVQPAVIAARPAVSARSAPGRPKPIAPGNRVQIAGPREAAAAAFTRYMILPYQSMESTAASTAKNAAAAANSAVISDCLCSNTSLDESDS